MNEQPERRAVDEEFEQGVAAYLRASPDFFVRNDHLLAELVLPHAHRGKTVSLIERQVALLREQKEELGRRLQRLAQVARDNEQLLDRFQQLILGLIDSPNLDAALNLIETSLRHDFRADAVVILLFRPDTLRSVDQGDQRLLPFAATLQQGRPLCGHLRREEFTALFGTGSEALQSGAVIPLNGREKGEALGLIAIGSIDPERFHPEMGTVFLQHLGAITSRVLEGRWGESRRRD